jgi:N-acetylglucosaminyldiphosphoundecaprenol N-acetyl-beta-D-mannosaminyltransferase
VQAPPAPIPVRNILGVNVAVSSYAETVAQALAWAENGESRTLIFANVHVIMEAWDDPDLREMINHVDLVGPDGVPLVWSLKALGEKSASRVYGPDATVAMLAAAEQGGVPVGFYGSSPQVIEALVGVVGRRHPALPIVFAESPPFRVLTPEEDADVVERITASGAHILFVGLGCPKQEIWVMNHVGRIPAVMFAVGAAFDFIAGTKAQAPRWVMRSGMEWAFRFATEPRRLARRYLRHNPRYVAFFLRQLLTGSAPAPR